MIEAALGTEQLDQLVERHVLVRKRVERRRLDALQELSERERGVNPAAQHQRIGEEADQRLGGDVGSIGDRCADGNVGLSGMAEQQDLESRHHGHEQRHALAAAEHPQRIGQVGGQRRIQTGAPIGLTRRAGAVRRQLQQRRGAGQRPGPVIGQPRQCVALQPLPLTGGVSGVLHRQRRQLERPPRGECRIQLLQLLAEHCHRPAVRDDVMQCQDEVVGLVIEDEDRGPKQGIPLQVEWPRRFRGQPIGDLIASPLARADFDHPDVCGRVRGDHLDRAAVHLDGVGPQDVVPGDDGIERAAQRRAVQRSANCEGPADVVKGPGRLQSVDEPEPFLRERERVRGHLSRRSARRPRQRHRPRPRRDAAPRCRPCRPPSWRTRGPRPTTRARSAPGSGRRSA